MYEAMIYALETLKIIIQSPALKLVSQTEILKHEHK